MQPAPSAPRIGRSVLAVVAGMFLGIVLSVATDAALHSAGVFPALGQRFATWQLILATAYRTVYGIGCAWITARLAPYRPLAHAMVLGALGFAANFLGAALTWGKGDQYGPHWYPIALTLLALPTSWLGGWLGARSSRSRPAAQ